MKIRKYHSVIKTTQSVIFESKIQIGLVTSNLLKKNLWNIEIEEDLTEIYALKTDNVLKAMGMPATLNKF